MKNLLLKILLAMIGFIIIGFAIGVMRVIDLGLDPLGAMTLGISTRTGLSFGAVLVIVQIPFLIMVFWWDRPLVGLGTVMGMFGVGYIVDFFYFLLTRLGFADLQLPLPVRIGILLVTLVVLFIGASVYMAAKLGMVPHDSAGFVFESILKKRIPFRWIRLTMDGVYTIIALILGSTIGIATAATVFTAGPLIGFLKPKIERFVATKIGLT